MRKSHLVLLNILFAVQRDCVRANFVVWGTERRGGSCDFSEIFYRVDHPMKEYLKHFLSAHNSRASAALIELAWVFPRCKTDQFSRSFLPAAVRLRNLLQWGVFSGGTLSSFKSAVNMCFSSLLAAVQIAWYHGPEAALGYRGIPFPSSLGQVFLVIIKIIIIIIIIMTAVTHTHRHTHTQLTSSSSKDALACNCTSTGGQSILHKRC